jgi:hypothetical protein
MGRIECGRVQGTTHTLLGLAGHDIPRVVAVDKVVVVEKLAGWQVLAWRCRCGWCTAGMPPTYGQHGLSERSLAKRLSFVPPRIHKRKRNISASFRGRPAATAVRHSRAEY